MNDSVRNRRTQYEAAGLDVADIDADPVAQWHRWHGEAHDAEVAEPNAMSLATTGADGVPDARIVLVRGVSAEGLDFYTSYDSTKSSQLRAHPVAAATFGWLNIHRQVRVRGNVEQLSSEASDAYFATRPRDSQLGAWSSPQSNVIAGRPTLEALVAESTLRFADVDEIPRPPNWGGWRLIPTMWEFWQGRPNRLHDRLRYRRPDDSAGAGPKSWLIERLAP